MTSRCGCQSSDARECGSDNPPTADARADDDQIVVVVVRGDLHGERARAGARSRSGTAREGEEGTRGVFREQLGKEKVKVLLH